MLNSTRFFEYTNSMPGYIAIALLSSVFMYLVLNKKNELSLEAIANMATSVLVTMANIVALILFADPLIKYIESAYDALNIPTIDPDFWKNMPLWLGIVAALAAKDFADYWNHRFMHGTKLGWLCHLAHHSDAHVNAFSTFRVHTLETLVMSISYTLLLTWMQLPSMIPLVVLLSVVHNMYVHMNLDIDHGPFKYLLASPMFHRWHHADVPEAYGKNLANIFPIYDVIFGTYYMPGPCRAPMGTPSTGVDGTDAVAIYLYPFRQAWRELRQRFGVVKPQPGRANSTAPAGDGL
jgi:sterol desaturase/sphingolipid hydroxylase (fatty acid hydroxylase superfamily)